MIRLQLLIVCSVFCILAGVAGATDNRDNVAVTSILLKQATPQRIFPVAIDGVPVGKGGSDSFQKRSPAATSAANSVIIPDITVTPNQQNVEIPIFITNDVDLAAVVVPLVMKTLSGAASITSARIEYRERFPGAFEFNTCLQRTDNDDNLCSGYPIVGTTCGTDYPVASMPEAFLFSVLNTVGSDLSPGTDAIGSLVLVVDIGPGAGTMLIDTSCQAPANKLAFVDANILLVPASFVAGTITVRAPAPLCTGEWMGWPAAIQPGWFTGNESYAVYQNPLETGCINPYPFEVNHVVWWVQAQAALSIDVQPMVWDYDSPDAIGAVLCAGPVNTYNLPAAGTYLFEMPFSTSCVVNGPYYAGAIITTYLGTDVLDIITDGGAVPPRSDAVFNDYGFGWEDLVDVYGYTSNLCLFSEGSPSEGCITPNCVDVQSKTVYAGQQDVEIPIFFTNDVNIAAVTVPLVIKTLSGAASITSARIEYRERFPGAFEVNACMQRTDNDDNLCSGYPIVGNTCGTDYPVASMPEAFLYAGLDFGGSNLSPGTDAIGSLVLIVDIGPGEGALLIDTSCMLPANTLSYDDPNAQSVATSFSAGVITVSSSCCINDRGNANYDPLDKANVSDVSYLVSWLFGIPQGPEPVCVEEANANGDIDEKTNVADVSYLVAWLFGVPTGPEPPACP